MTLRVGIVGGGQLAKMMTVAAKQLGFDVIVLDPTPGSPAGQIADEEMVGSFTDPNPLRDLAQRSDVVTFDIEHIDSETLKTLKVQGHPIYPSPNILEMVQDKWSQKEFYIHHKIPTPQALEDGRFPAVQKLKRGGYDGKGVAILRSRKDLPSPLIGPSFMEEWIPIQKELAIIAARSKKGEIRLYPIVEMKFHPKGNLLDLLSVPADISKKVAGEVTAISQKILKTLEYVGVMGIEFFYSKKGKIYVNEIAPRPHNSGHYTIEACVTSQFEQHIRAIAGLPLGSTELLKPAAMINLLGPKGISGPPKVEGLSEAMKISGVSVHIYGKKESRPLRKMGHVTVIAEDVGAARRKALRVQKIVNMRVASV